MLRATLTSIWCRKRRLLGASTAVVIGVAFLVSTLVLGDSMRSGFDSSFTDAYAGTDVVVRNKSEIGSNGWTQVGTLDESLVDVIAAMPDVARVAPGIEGVAQIIAADGDPIGGDGPPTFGTNWLDETGTLLPGQPGFNSYSIVDGRAPTGDREVVIDRGSAKVGKLRVGDTTTVLTPDPVSVHIVGIAAFGKDDNIGGSSFVGFTFDDAQRLLLTEPGTISNVQIAAVAGVTPDKLRAELRRVLPSSGKSVTRSELIAEQNQNIDDEFLGFFEAFLLAFAIVALLVAAFSIHNTFSILVAQRSRESALMRALGASRRQVIAAVTVESLVLGAFASAIGVGSGVGLAAGLKALMDAAGFGLPGAVGLEVATDTIVIAMIVGVAVTLFASVAPAVKASRIAPLAALRDLAVDRSGASTSRAIVGTVFSAGGIATVLSSTSAGDGALARAGLGALLTLVGAVILGPVVATLATSVLGAPIAATRGHAGSLARRNAMRNPRRSAGTASALMIGTAVVALFATFGSSIKASFDDIISTSFSNELVIAQDGFTGAPLSAELTPAIAALPQVSGAVALANAPVDLGGDEKVALAADPAGVARVADLDVSQGSFDQVGDDGFAVTKAYAANRGWTLGMTVPVSFADGDSTTLTLRAIFDNKNAIGDVLIPTAAWRPHQGRSGDAVILIGLVDGATVSDAKVAVQTVADRFGRPDVQDRTEYITSNTEQIDQMLGLIYGLLGLAILIAVLGIANTLSLSIHERTREIGLLRAVGQTRGQLRSTVRWESVILAIFGTIGGVSLGSFLGWGVIRAMRVQEGFGTFQLPIASLVIVLAMALCAGVIAAVRPARRAAKLDILAAIATA
ncbi:MAG: FtsX-like permease family protein [Ilumatobacteraceae bacterium]